MNHGNGGHTQTHYATTKQSREFYEHKFPIYTFNNSNYFPAGQYSFPFSFVLGEDLPGSFERRWHEHGHESYGKIKYKLKAGFKDKSSGSKLFGKLKFVVEEKYTPGQTNVAPPLYDKDVQGYCYTSHGNYKMCAVFGTDRYIVGDKASLSVAVDASEASTDIKNLKCELVLKTHLHANGRNGHSKEKLQTIHLGRVEAGKALINEDSITVQLDIRTPGELQATASGELVKNNYYLQWVAEVDGCVCYDTNPKNKVLVKVFNKHFGQPSPANHFMGDQPWQPQTYDPYYAQLNDNQFRMDEAFKMEYKPNYQKAS